jgi:hypothetical protein
MTVALQELDLKDFLNEFWKVEVLTNLPITYMFQYSDIHFDFGGGDDHGGYSLHVGVQDVFMRGGIFDQEKDFLVTREDPLYAFQETPKRLKVGNSMMFCDDSNGLIVVKFTRKS